MTWLTVTEYLCHGYVTFVVITIPLRVCNKSNTAVVTSGAGIAYPSGTPESIPVLVVFVNHCSSFFLFLLAIVLSVLLRFMASDYPFGIFKLFLTIVTIETIYNTINSYLPYTVYKNK